jgi:hypothetical protein
MLLPVELGIEYEEFALWDLVPPELRGILLNLTWNNAELWALPLPVEQVSVATLSWQLDVRWWRHAGQYFAIRPTEVAADPERYAAHWQRTMAADLRWPIHVVERNDRLVILDGVHRLLKAHLAGATEIAARRMTVDDVRRIARRRS